MNKPYANLAKFYGNRDKEVSGVIAATRLFTVIDVLLPDYAGADHVACWGKPAFKTRGSSTRCRSFKR